MDQLLAWPSPPSCKLSTMTLSNIEKRYSFARSKFSIKFRKTCSFIQLPLSVIQSKYLLFHLFHSFSIRNWIFRTTSKEDMEEKYIRVLATTLIAYGTLLDLMTSSASGDVAKQSKILGKSAETHCNILKESKFWKLAHHSNDTIRQAWFVFAGSLGKVLPVFVAADVISRKHVDKLISYVFGKLDEVESSISQALWDAALYIIHSYQVKTSNSVFFCAFGLSNKVLMNSTNLQVANNSLFGSL